MSLAASCFLRWHSLQFVVEIVARGSARDLEEQSLTPSDALGACLLS
jgi:hypothetical protein